MNWYAYCGGVPINCIDLWGLVRESDKPLYQLSYGVRGAMIIGGSASVGIVYNPNNPWDSGVSFTIGVGTGFEVAAITPLNPVVTTAIDLVSSSVNFSNPTSTEQIEGISNTVYTGAGVGISADLNSQSINGITTGSVGGGVYTEATVVITAGEIIENIANTGIAIMNGILNYSGMSNLIGNFNYIELDGRE